jgi:hypothetical protein
MGRYDSEWRSYRRLMLLSLLFVLPFLPALIRPHVLDFLDLPIPIPVLFVCGLVGVVAWFRLNSFRCPRCGKRFASTWWFNLSVFTWRCVHCGLKKFGDGE